MIFLNPPVQRARKEGGGERKLPVVCILCISVTYSADTDIRTVVKCWYDAHFFCQEPQDRRGSRSQDEAPLQPRLTHA